MKLQENKQSKYKNVKPLIKSTVKPLHSRNESKPPLIKGSASKDLERTSNVQKSRRLKHSETVEQMANLRGLNQSLKTFKHDVSKELIQ